MTVKEPEHANRLLDAIRGLAALFVVLGHARAFYENATGTTSGDLPAWQKLALLPTSVALESVAVFFVLSGYLVGGQVLRQLRGDRFSWPEFTIKRLSRMWTVLLPGLALTAVLAWLSSRYDVSDRIVEDHSSLSTAACNVVFLQESRCETFGTNTALWSLSYEFWFYLVFPAACLVVVGLMRRRPLMALGNLAVVAVVTVLFGPALFKLIPAWLLGVVVAEVVRQPWARQLFDRMWLLLVTAVVLGMAMIANGVIDLSRTWRTTAIGVPAALLIIVAVEVGRRLHGPLVELPARMGDWSFSLYVFHAPMVVLLVAAAYTAGILERLGPVLGAYLVAAVVVPLCWAVSRVTERYTPEVRERGLALVRERRVARTG